MLSFTDEELRTRAINRIDSDLAVNTVQYTLITGAQKEQAKRDELAAGASFTASRSETHDVGLSPIGSVAYDLVGEVASAAAITRRSAAKILQGINPNVFGLFRVNPEEFIKKTAQLIVAAKATLVVDRISYHEIDQTFDTSIFTQRMPDSASKAYETKKGIQRFVFPASEIEREFAKELDLHDEVAVYAKLPRSFKIPTPMGDYAPDWAIAFKKGSVKHVFFIAETKGAKTQEDLSEIERDKIACAKKLFNQMSTSDVRYYNVYSYENLIAMMNRID